MSYLFHEAGMYANNFNIDDISVWDTSKVTECRLFNYAYNYDAPIKPSDGTNLNIIPPTFTKCSN